MTHPAPATPPLQGVTIEGFTPTAWGAAGAAGSTTFLTTAPRSGSPAPAPGDVIWEAPTTQQQQPGGRQLAVRRLVLHSADLWGSLVAAGRRRLLAVGAGSVGGAPLVPSYVFLDVTVRFTCAALAAAAGTHPNRRAKPSAAVIGGAVGGAVGAVLLGLLVSAFVVRARRARRAGGAGGSGADSKGLLPVWANNGHGAGGGPGKPPPPASDAGAAGSTSTMGAGSNGIHTSASMQQDAASLFVRRLRSETAAHISRPIVLRGGTAAAAAAAALGDPSGRAAASSAPHEFGGLIAAAAAHAQHTAQQARLDAWRRPDSTCRASSGPSAQEAQEGLQQRQQFESAARAVQQLHQGTEWRHTQEDLVLESVLGEGTFGMVRGALSRGGPGWGSGAGWLYVRGRMG